MKKKHIIMLILAIILAGASYLAFTNITAKLPQNNIFITKTTDNLYTVKNNSELSIWDMEYQEIIDKKIQKLSKKKYTLDNPLMILNPYGTNTTGVNIYFTTDEELEISYTVSVNNKQIPDFSQTLKNDSPDNYTKKHKYQIIGLIPDRINSLKLVGTNRNGEKVEANLQIDMNSSECDEEVMIMTFNGESEQPLTDGLFVQFISGGPINIYDNDGILRANLILNNTESHRIIFNNGNLYYKYAENIIGVFDRMGKLTKQYISPNHRIHHDYVMDEENEKIIALATSYEEADERVGDMLIIIDMKTGNVEKVIDMAKLLPEMYEIAKKSYGDKIAVSIQGLDWAHLNSITFAGEKDDIIISSREMSSIIYLENIYNETNVKYIIADEAVYENTVYDELVYTKKGDFVSQACQHTVEYIEDESLADGQYYLIMFNNNWGENYSRDDFPWHKYPGTGDYIRGEKSMYYKYLVDENKKSYELVDEIDVGYSSTVSSVQQVGNNLIIAPGNARYYEEYDKNGVSIKNFFILHNGAYRVYKYDFKNSWFK